MFETAQFPLDRPERRPFVPPLGDVPIYRLPGNLPNELSPEEWDQVMLARILVPIHRLSPDLGLVAEVVSGEAHERDGLRFSRFDRLQFPLSE